MRLGGEDYLGLSVRERRDYESRAIGLVTVPIASRKRTVV